jgi:flagella basal body P-ring formation protein FlgA
MAGLFFAYDKEIMNTVKTSTPMNTRLQMLCRLLDQMAQRGLWLGVVLWLSGAAAVAAPQAAGSAPALVLQKSVTQWVAKEQSVALDSVVLAPLDPRLQVRACEKALVMDLPFSSPETVRVRCPEPVWQLYVRVSVTGRPGGRPVLSGSAAQAEAKAPPEKRSVLVAAMPLQRGMILTEAHVRLAEVDTSNMLPNVLEQVSQVMHAELVRDIRPDTPLRAQDLRPTVLVKRGQLVLMSVGQAQGFQISARVEAMQDGRFGEQVKLKNRESGRILSGTVIGPNKVEGL